MVDVIDGDHPLAPLFAREAADQNFPAAARRIEQLTMLLSTGLLLNAHGGAETAPADEDVEAAESAAEAIVEALISGATTQLATFLKDGQSTEIADEVFGWLALATGAYWEEGAAQ